MVLFMGFKTEEVLRGITLTTPSRETDAERGGKTEREREN